jgi:hypothetical protein
MLLLPPELRFRNDAKNLRLVASAGGDCKLILLGLLLLELWQLFGIGEWFALFGPPELEEGEFGEPFNAAGGEVD